MKTIKLPIKIDRMPTTLALSVFSLLITILGLGIGCYLIFFNFGNIISLKHGYLILLGSLLLAVLIRMLGNMGQMLFDLRMELQKQSLSINNDLRVLFERNERLVGLLNDKFEKVCQYIRDGGISLNQNLSFLNNNIKAELQEHTKYLHLLSDKFENLSKNLKEGNESVIQNIREGIKNNREGSESVIQNIREQNKYLYISLEKFTKISQDLELLNCDSKDLSHNLNEIKNFFAQIEKHLDLKK